MLEREPAATAALLDRLQDEVQNVIADIRRLVYQLRPPELDELGSSRRCASTPTGSPESDLPDRYIWTGSL